MHPGKPGKKKRVTIKQKSSSFESDESMSKSEESEEHKISFHDDEEGGVTAF